MQLFEIHGPVGRVVQRMASARWFRFIAPFFIPHLDRLAYRLTRGRFTFSQLLSPMLILVTTGRKSGLERETPLICVPEGNTWWVVGSNYGKATHPAWTSNLIANPDAEVRFKGRTVPVTAELLEAERRVQKWRDLTRYWPVYSKYADDSGRQLRIFHLVPRDGVD